MSTAPTKRQVLAALRENQAGLARRFNVTRAAICHWPDDEPIPMLRWLQLKHELAPEVFSVQGAELQQEAA